MLQFCTYNRLEIDQQFCKGLVRGGRVRCVTATKARRPVISGRKQQSRVSRYETNHFHFLVGVLGERVLSKRQPVKKEEPAIFADAAKAGYAISGSVYRIAATKEAEVPSSLCRSWNSTAVTLPHISCDVESGRAPLGLRGRFSSKLGLKKKLFDFFHQVCGRHWMLFACRIIFVHTANL